MNSADEPVGYVCPLRPRELETLTHFAAGKTTKEIAREMGVSPYTVEGYVASSKDLLGTRTIPGLVAHVMRKGWIS